MSGACATTWGSSKTPTQNRLTTDPRARFAGSTDGSPDMGKWYPACFGNRRPQVRFLLSGPCSRSWMQCVLWSALNDDGSRTSAGLGQSRSHEKVGVSIGRWNRSIEHTPLPLSRVLARETHHRDPAQLCSAPRRWLPSCPPWTGTDGRLKGQANPGSISAANPRRAQPCPVRRRRHPGAARSRMSHQCARDRADGTRPARRRRR